jgi:hypothetical protein
MGASPLFARAGRSLRPTRFVFVNDRIPNTETHCALCGRKIEDGYVRESQTSLLYCDTQCLAGHTMWRWLRQKRADESVTRVPNADCNRSSGNVGSRRGWFS